MDEDEIRFVVAAVVRRPYVHCGLTIVEVDCAWGEVAVGGIVKG